jgi:hypothetical protein
MTALRYWLRRLTRGEKAKMTPRRRAIIAACAVLVLAGSGCGVWGALNHLSDDRVAAAKARVAHARLLAIAHWCTILISESLAAR